MQQPMQRSGRRKLYLDLPVELRNHVLAEPSLVRLQDRLQFALRGGMQCLVLIDVLVDLRSGRLDGHVIDRLRGVVWRVLRRPLHDKLYSRFDDS